MAITLPYTPTANADYGTVTWSSMTTTSDGDLYEYRTMTSQGYSTINSFTRQTDGTFLMNITIYSYSLITRTNTGYARGNMTFQTTPLIQIYNQTLATAITVYNSALTTVVSNAVTGSITHSTTVNVTVPYNWFTGTNITWYLVTQQVVTCTTTAETATHIKSESTFEVPLNYNMTVRYADALYTVKYVWVRSSDALQPALKINVDYGGTIR